MIETARLLLRPPSADDLPFILAEINTAAMMRYLGGEARPAEQVAEALDADIAAFADGSWLRWTVFVKDSERRVGRIGLFRVRSDKAPEEIRGQREIGWMLGEAHQGRGYASEAAAAVLDYGFAELALPQIYAQTSDSNAASTRMMHRLGFTPRPELGYIDPDYPAADNPTTVFSLSRGEWASHERRVRD